MSDDLADSTLSSYKEQDISQLLYKLWKHKLTIIIITGLFAAGGIFYALSLPNVYTAEALLAPVSEQSGLKIPGQLGGLAALAGVNVGNLTGGGDNTKIALEVLKSRDFLGRFIIRHDLLLPIMAAKNWNREQNLIVIDSELYDESNQLWIRKINPPFSAKPSILEAFKEFDEMLKVREDKLTGLVRIEVTHVSPVLAKQLVDWLVDDLNFEMREQERREAEHSINYLSKQLETTTLAEIKTMLYSLIEEQTKTLMLANVREEYVLKTIDPAVTAEEKSGPKRAFIVILFVLLGGFLSTAVVFSVYRD